MADDSKCGFEGNSDMYGMGIRIGYYLQWYGAILGAWIAPDEAKDLRIANSLFVTATFLALVILTIRDHSPEDMPVVETYIVLFLTFSSYLVLVPIYIWRALTGFNKRWDPMRFPRVRPGRIYNVCNTIILVTVLLFQLWFWIHQVPKLDGEECPQYGFFFGKFRLNSKTFRAINIAPSFFLLGICIYSIGMIVWRKVVRGQSVRENSKGNYVPLEEVSRSHKYTLQILESVCQFITTTAIVVGVELTILWNHIEGVHEIASAGQTIPLFIGIAAVSIVIYVRFFKQAALEFFGVAPANNKPTMTAQSAPTQAWDMEHGNHSYYGQTAYPYHGQISHAPAPAQPPSSALDNLPGGIRSSTHL